MFRSDPNRQDLAMQRLCSYRLSMACFAIALMMGCNRSDETGDKPSERGKETSAWFKDRRKELGISHAWQSGATGDFLFPEIIGGGGAVFDYDNDGDLDLYFCGGGSLVDESKFQNKLYRNDGSQGFTDVTKDSGLNHSGYGMGCAAIDFDRDGFVDLFLTHFGKTLLYRNLGNQTFRNVTAEANVMVPGWTTSAAAFDANGDGWPDLYVCRYVDWNPENEIRCRKPSGSRDYCSPNSYNRPTQDVILINQGNGTFVDKSLQLGKPWDRGNGLGVVPCDFDNDGDVDLFVANDMNPAFYWVNDGTGGFENQAMAAGCAVDRDGAVKAGMGTCVGDLNRDGLMDLVVVNLEGQSDSFFENKGGMFVDRTAQKGMAVDSRSFTRFGVGWHDFNNDGHFDIFLANGKVVLPGDVAVDNSDPFAESNMVMTGNPDGRFFRLADELAGDVAAVATSRAAIFGDLNNDGKLDVVVINRDSECQVLFNRAPDAGNWVGFDLRDSEGVLALGSVVQLKTSFGTERRDVNPHYSYLASNDHRVHFGLAKQDSSGDVIVKWPNGDTETFGPFKANAYYTLKKGSGRK